MRRVWKYRNGRISLQRLIQRNGDEITFPTHLKITYKDIYPYITGKDTLKEHTEVWIRRHLSELRDNYISKNELLLSISKKAIQLKRSVLD